MAALVPVELVRDAPGLELVVERRRVLRHHVPVVVAVREQHRRLEVGDVVHVVARVPERRVVAGDAVLRRGDVGDHRPADRLVGPRVGVLGEHVGVLALEAAGRAHHAVRAVVVVPARDRRDRDDRLEALDPGRGDADRQRAVVGRADHADLAGRPGGGDLGAADLRGVGLRAAVEPVDDRLRPERLERVAGRRAAGREAGAGALGVHDREPARHPRRDVRVRDDRARVEEVGRGHRPRRRRLAELVVDGPVDHVDVAAVVRADLHHDRHLEPDRVGLLHAGHVDVDAVEHAVEVAVDGRLDPELLADPGRRHRREDGLRLAVHEDRARDLGAGRLRGDGENDQDGQRQRDRDGPRCRPRKRTVRTCQRTHTYPLGGVNCGARILPDPAASDKRRATGGRRGAWRACPTRGGRRSRTRRGSGRPGGGRSSGAARPTGSRAS